MNPNSLPDARVTLRARFRSATREAILEAAADLLGADGATQTRMEDIAARAGVAVGTVYNYFEDRKTLVSALLETRIKGLLEALDASLAPPAKGAAATPAPDARTAFQADLERFVAAFTAHIESNRFLFAVLRDEERVSGVDATSQSRRTTLGGELLGKAGRLMDRGLKARVLRRDDAELYGAMLVGMLRGVALRSLTRTSADLRRDMAAMVRVFMSGAAR